MTTLDSILAELGVTIDAEQPAIDSHSGSQVSFARLDDRPVVVKVTSEQSGQTLLRAHREVDVLRHSRLAIRRPQLLSWHGSDELVVVVMERLQPAGSAEQWTAQRWLAFAECLAGLHQSPAPPEMAPVMAAQLLSVDDPLIARAFPGPERELIRHVFAAGRIDTDLGFEPTFVHGDCHLDNVLLTKAGEVALADWQNCGMGDPTADLAFALTRSIPTGAEPDVDQIVSRYANARSLDEQRVARAVSAHRLQFIALQFPHFLDYLEPVQIARLRSTWVRLATQWLDSEFSR